MARAQDQVKWLQSSGRRRVEAPLPHQTVDKLDRIAADRGVSRAQAITDLVESAPEPGGAPATARDDDTRDMFGGEYQPDDSGEAKPQAEPESQAGTAKTDVPTHKLRKAKGEAPDGGDAWAVYLSGTRVGIAYRNTNPNEQRAADVRWIAVCERDATRKRYRYRTRTQAVEMMLKVERPHERGRR